MNAKIISANAFRDARVSARSLDAPNDFWMSPGEMMNAGKVRNRNVHPEAAPSSRRSCRTTAARLAKT